MALLGYTDVFLYNFFQYGQKFKGSIRGMNYHIGRFPLENVFFNNDPHKNDDAQFEVVIWRGPLGFEATPEDRKIVQYFPFTDEGRTMAIDYINAKYEEQPEFWAEGMKLFGG